MIRNLLLVGAGGALGSVARYMLTILLAHFAICGEIAILLANVIGSFLIGLLIPMLSNGNYLFAVVGVCGGFTTFSTFSSQALNLFQNGERLIAMAYMIASVVISLLAVLLGMYVAGKLVK